MIHVFLSESSVLCLVIKYFEKKYRKVRFEIFKGVKCSRVYKVECRFQRLTTMYQNAHIVRHSFHAMIGES